MPLHAMYIDFKKAYNSVEHWVFDEIFAHLNAGHFGQVVCNLLANSSTSLCINNMVSNTTILFGRDTKQGDIISPVA